MIVAMGIRDTGKKDVLGFVQAASENHLPICEMLRDILRRGLKYEKGLLVIIDGSTGIRKAIEVVFGSMALVQRCQWHKRENVLSYLNDELKQDIKVRINGAYAQNDYARAKQELLEIIEDLKPINIHASKSMLEGLEETLTLHKIKMNGRFGKTFSTTNCIESLKAISKNPFID